MRPVRCTPGSAVFATALLITVAVAGVAAPCQESEHPVRAPEALPGTTEDMLDPGFWISRIDNPDRVLMTVEEIGALNEKNATRVIPDDHPYARNIARIERDGPVFNRMDPLGIMGGHPGDEVRERLAINNDRLREGTFYDRWALPLTDNKKNDWIDAVNIDAVPATIEPEFGMIVRHTSARLYPTDEPSYRMRGYLDDNNVTSLDIAMPVAVMHASKSGDYCFVMSPITWGWVPSRDIGIGNAPEVERYNAMRRFVVCTRHEVPLYADRDLERHNGALRLGERVAIRWRRGMSEEPGESGPYHVIVPVRRHNGLLGFEDSWAPRGEGINEGWLPYTQANVIETAFSILGRPYGWHDSWNERDCGGIMRVIFNCFGFTLPRYWSFEQLCTDHARYVGDIEDAAEKNRILAGLPAGVTFTGTTGHIGLYLGTVDGKPYTIHQCGWNYTLDDVEYKMARVVVSDYESIGFNMKSIGFFSPILP